MAEGIGLLDLASGMSRRGVSIAPETGLFVALQVTEALRDAPGAFAVGAVRITSEGGIEMPARTSIDEPAAVESVAAVCDALLNPPTAPLRALLVRMRKGEIAKIDALRAEIEALLVPLNRAAAKRVLGRFVREHQRLGGEAASAEPTTPAIVATPVASPEPIAVVPSVTAKQEPPDAVSGALDTAPDAVPDPAPAGVSPLPTTAAGGKSALDTEPDASAGISAMLAHPVGEEGRVSHANLTNPRIPGPPPLGSLTAIPTPRANADVEPGAYPVDRTRPDTRPPAMDTAIDGQVLARSRSSEQTDFDGEITQPRRSGSRVVLVIAFGSLFVALALLAFALSHR